MSVVQEVCPSCAAPLTVPEGASRIKCPYCSTSLATQRHGSEVALTVASAISSTLEKSGVQTQEAIKEGTYVTQSELRRLQVAQDLSMAQMRLANVQGEIRTIERLPQTPVTRKQLRELRTNEADLQRQIKTVKDIISPPAAPASPPPSKPLSTAQENRQWLTWLLFSATGRASRRDYWIGMAVLFVILLLIEATVPTTIDPATGEPTTSSGFFSTILSLLALWIGFAVAAKRYHDVGKSAWWVLIVLIPMIGFFWQIIELGFSPGDSGPNQYS